MDKLLLPPPIYLHKIELETTSNCVNLYLKNDKDDGKEAVYCVDNIQTVGVKINDEVGYELQ